MYPPLAGKPPFATDEPDSFYESSPVPQPRVRKQPPHLNKRSSAYDVYDNYLGDNATNRQSGVGALGMGLLNMNDDDDDDVDDDTQSKPQPQSPTTPPSSKHAALAAATSAAKSPRSPPPQYIAQPRPGYVAPIAALNLARPEAAAFPPRNLPPAAGEDPFELKNPFEGPLSSPRTPYQPMPSPSPSMTEPLPLQPPITPITPVFARPAQPSITFSDSAVPRPRKPIMRSDTEGTLLPNRGEKGDDFWRRFSMVAKVENHDGGQKQSSWLRKTQDGSTRLSRWVWVVGVFFLICIGGGIGLGWYFSHNSPSHQQPTAIGGSANEIPGTSQTTPSATGPGGSSVLHVQPTFTVARRASEPSGIPASHHLVGAVRKHKKRMQLH